ncbi:MAG: hypothetical protein MSC57_05755 [Peptoniphilaceae bacterium]|nr:hypothetical protein [Peptoniphilaceae bacterium]
MDATYLKVRENRRTVSKAMMIAYDTSKAGNGSSRNYRDIAESADVRNRLRLIADAQTAFLEAA